MYLALGNLGVVIQDVGDRPGDVRVVARFPGGLTVSSSATALTPYTREAARTAANFCAQVDTALEVPGWATAGTGWGGAHQPGLVSAWRAASADGSDLEGRRQIVVDDQHNLPWDVVLLHCAVRLGRVLPVVHG